MKSESNRLLNLDSDNTFILPQRMDSKTILIWGFLSILLLSCLFVFKPTLFQSFDFNTYDLLIKNFPKSDIHNSSIKEKHSPIVVDLDEKSLKKYGQWPWSRYKVAELLDKVVKMEPAVIALDIIFAEPDRTSAKILLKELEDTYSLKQLSIANLPYQFMDNDIILANSIEKGDFILGYKFHFNNYEKSSKDCLLHPINILLFGDMGQKREEDGILKSSGVLCNLPILSQKASFSGFLNFSPDQDGMVRRLPLLIEHNGNFYPNLAFATVLKLYNIDTLVLKRERGVLKTINYNETSIPVDQYGQMLIKFRGPKMSYKYISAADILDEKISVEILKEQIVFIGTSANGLKELRTTPFDPIFPGVEVHATVADNILKRDFISIPIWSDGLKFLLILFFCMLLTLVIAFRGSVSGFFVMAMFVVGLFSGTVQICFYTGLFIGTSFPIASVLFHYIFLTSIKYWLEEKMMISNMKELLLTQDITIESMANLTEYRDSETGGHIRRTRIYVKMLAEHIRRNSKYKKYLSDTNIDMLYKSSPLHDIGKVGIPDNILLKPESLTSEEFEIMKSHTTIGRNVIEASVRKLGKSSFLTVAAEMAYSHQERWDGSGYPQGLKGEAIPLSGRIMALADVYDALISARVYKPPFSHERAVEIIKQGRGSQFDPDMVDAFLQIHEQFKNIAITFVDSETLLSESTKKK